MNDLVDPSWWDCDRDGQVVLGDPERRQVLLDEDLTRMDRRHRRGSVHCSSLLISGSRRFDVFGAAGVHRKQIRLGR